jgi:HK97 family phage prohead protease
MPHEYKTLAFELKADSEKRRLTGHGAIFNNIDAGGDIIAPGAFQKHLGEFIADGFVGGLNHDWDDPIASISSASEDEKGLIFESNPIKSTPMGEKVLALVSEPHPVVKTLSIGYSTVVCKYLNGTEECKAYWAGVGYDPTPLDLERSKGQVRLLIELKTFEISPTTKSMNELASIHGVKSLESKDFAEHSRKVASTLRETVEGVEAFVSRYQSRMDARLKSGRAVSRANWTALKEVYDTHMGLMDQHKAMCEKMKGFLDSTDPDAESEPDDTDPNEAFEHMLGGKSAAFAVDSSDIAKRLASVLYATSIAV